MGLGKGALRRGAWAVQCNVLLGTPIGGGGASSDPKTNEHQSGKVP